MLMTMDVKRWDVAERLDSSDSIVGYLDILFEEKDPALTVAFLGDVAKAIGMSIISEKIGVDRQALFDAYLRNGRTSEDVVEKALRSLKAKLESEQSVTHEAAE
jgi:probable addiction module antidote protein